MKLPLLVPLKNIINDLKGRIRGARKIIVTKIYDNNEVEYKESIWKNNGQSKSPVIKMDTSELAYFTNKAVQDRHYHKKATEIYTILDGSFTIDIDGSEFELVQGDTIVVPPNAIHKIDNSTQFVAQVVTVNCYGASDKYISEN